jgi:hypothetical protein
MKLIPALTAVALVAAISYGLARGGDHGGDHGDRGSYGGPTQTWCDVDSHCNGWDKMIAELEAHPGQDPAVPYGIFKPAIAQYAVGARTVPLGAFAMAQLKVRLVQIQQKRVRVAIRRPLNILPPIAAVHQPQAKIPTFASTLLGVQ